MDLFPVFDFKSYLADLTGVEWIVDELDGGNANHTIRATPKNYHSNSSHHGKGTDLLLHPSIVLKQAPPYMAKFPSLLFSQYRQTIEANALELLNASSSETIYGLSHVLNANPHIKVPKLLLHDPSSVVLVQSDLGKHPLLDKFLSSPATSPNLAARAGSTLGQFLAHLHHAFDDGPSVYDPTSALVSSFRNDGAESVLEGIIGNVTQFMKDAAVPDYDVLGERALTHWQQRKKTAFGQGDVWFGTIIVDSGGETDAVTVGICDWEFAGPNHPAGDIAQLGSYLHLFSMSPMTTPSSMAAIEAFAKSFYSSYFSSGFNLSSTSEAREFQRTFLILHGWEMVNAGAWRHRLWCTCPGEGVKCEHITRMVEVGALLLRAAGPDSSEDVRWELLKEVEWCKLLKFG